MDTFRKCLSTSSYQCFIFWPEAYCSFVNGRLPTEVEWEYVATNLSETIYPWGDQDITDEYGNFFIKFSGTNNVNEYDISNTRLSIKQMIGNCLEYCNSIFKPYDNFCIDVIEDFSNYKHFGKVICKEVHGHHILLIVILNTDIL